MYPLVSAGGRQRLPQTSGRRLCTGDAAVAHTHCCYTCCSQRQSSGGSQAAVDRSEVGTQLAGNAWAAVAACDMVQHALAVCQWAHNAAYIRHEVVLCQLGHEECGVFGPGPKGGDCLIQHQQPSGMAMAKASGRGQCYLCASTWIWSLCEQGHGQSSITQPPWHGRALLTLFLSAHLFSGVWCGVPWLICKL